MKRQNIMGTMRYAIERHQMISDGDFVAVGLSGGKDSMGLLHLMRQFQRFADVRFKLAAVSIDPGFDAIQGCRAPDFHVVREFCDSIGVPLHVVPTDIADIVFNIRREKNPCSLCANMRRGALATAMNRLGMNKLALGHHEKDLVTTFFMNLVHGGRIKTLEPVSYLDHTGITVIRPMIYVKEKSIVSYNQKYAVPTITSPCPVDKKTARQNADALAEQLYRINEHAESAIVRAVRSLIDVPGEDNAGEDK